jgi:hypothetical protein
MKDTKENAIKIITAVPRSKNFCNFYINGTDEKRSAKLEDLAKWITEVCPAVGGQARLMIYEFRPFCIEVEAETITELSEDPEPMETHRDAIFKRTGKRILMNDLRAKPKNNLDIVRQLFNNSFRKR